VSATTSAARSSNRPEDGGEGHHIIKLNIGNLAAFGFDSPEEIQLDMIRNLPSAAGYSDAKGIFSARKAVMHYTQQKHIKGVTLEDIYIGNGVSELIVMAMNALLNAGDEVLVPTPDYPLWTAAVSLSSGTPRHYLCDEGSDWLPDLKDLRAKITPRTRALVVINPNNPTGALYPDHVLLEMVDIARQHNLIIYADEVYDKVLYDGATHTAIASLSTDVLTVTFNGLSKNYRSCGYRAGWMVVSGDLREARDYIEGLDMLSSMRLCSNVPGQHAIQTALGGYQSIDDLVAPGGRMCRQRDLAHELITAIPGVSCVKPKAALYMFPRLDPKLYPIGTTRSSSPRCCRKNACCWSRAAVSTGRIPITSAWFSCRTKTTCATRSRASHVSGKLSPARGDSRRGRPRLRPRPADPRVHSRRICPRIS
jgi:alanine-synthesizing transaminase